MEYIYPFPQQLLTLLLIFSTILPSMELAKTNLLQLSLIDTTLNANFALIERYLTHLRSDVRTLFRTSNSLVEKINAMDPFEEIPLPLPS